jgi:peptide/nickel transport system permease protein
MSGDPTTFLLSAEAATEDRVALRQALGLDKSIPEQFAIYVADALQGDLGTSFTHRRPVVDVLAERLPATIELAIAAMLVSIVIGIPLGVWTAVRRGTWSDRLVQVTAIVGMSAPAFWIGIMLVTLFGGYLRWLPTYGRDGPQHLILPVVTLAFFLVASMIRLTRSSMLEVLGSEYVKFARMRGLSRSRMIWKHALKNALIPVITFAGIMLASLLNGTVVVESVFGWPGVGSVALQAVEERNFPLLQGAVLLSGFLYITTALIVDLTYAYVDPRIRESRRAAHP